MTTGMRLFTVATVASVRVVNSSQRRVWHSPKVPVVVMTLMPSRTA